MRGQLARFEYLCSASSQYASIFLPGTLGLSACTCLKHPAINVRLSALVRCVGEVVFSCDAMRAGGFAGAGEGVCCARATVATDSAAKANAARFTVHLLCSAYSLVSPLQARLSDTADIYT